MRVNVNHPSFIQFLENVTNNILTNISVNNYFSLSNDKKLVIQYTTLKLMKTSLKSRAKLSDQELKSFIIVLCKKNEILENYEFAQILKDITNNFDNVNEKLKPVKRKIRKPKVDIKNNG